MNAEIFCIVSACAFFLSGLLSGAWKYACIARAADARAPAYVDAAHRTSLLYAFACTLLAELCQRSAWANSLNLVAAALLVGFFAASVIAYVVHGVLRDTDNQFLRPHRLGRRTIPAGAMRAFMSLLIAAELGGFGVLFTGMVASLR